MEYDLSDDDVHSALVVARSIVDSKSATALEFLELVKLILEHDLDVKENVQYVLSGICRRTVFEYTKRRMSCKYETCIGPCDQLPDIYFD